MNLGQLIGDPQPFALWNALLTVTMTIAGPFVLTVVLILNAVVNVKPQIALKDVFVMLVISGMGCNV